MPSGTCAGTPAVAVAAKPRCRPRCWVPHTALEVDAAAPDACRQCWLWHGRSPVLSVTVEAGAVLRPAGEQKDSAAAAQWLCAWNSAPMLAGCEVVTAAALLRTSTKFEQNAKRRKPGRSWFIPGRAKYSSGTEDPKNAEYFLGGIQCHGLVPAITGVLVECSSKGASSISEAYLG